MSIITDQAYEYFTKSAYNDVICAIEQGCGDTVTKEEIIGMVQSMLENVE